MLDTNILQVVTEWKKFVPSYDTCFYTKRDDGIVVFGLTGNALLYGINKLLGNTGIKIDRLSKDLKEADALITYAKGNEQTKIYRNKRYYEINKTALDEFCDIMESRR
jgi:hypothetical protein